MFLAIQMCVLFGVYVYALFNGWSALSCGGMFLWSGLTAIAHAELTAERLSEYLGTWTVMVHVVGAKAAEG